MICTTNGRGEAGLWSLTGGARAAAGGELRVRTRRGSATMEASTNHGQLWRIENDWAVTVSVDEQ